MSKEEMREGFEAWHCEQYKTKHTTGAPTRDMHGGVYDEKYGPPKQQALWECWQETGGDAAKVEALKEEIERIELGKQAVAFLMLGDIFHGVDGPEVDDWDIQYDHKVCNALAQMNPGAQIPLFTRSDAGEVDRLREELAELEDEFDTLEHSNISLKLSLQAAEQRNAELVKLLRIMAGDYARCLEAGYDRITFLGGDCDSVEKMLNDNPSYAKAIAALKPAESGASNEQ